MKHRVAIIGGGIVGLATAWKLSQALPDLSITLLEKEGEVGKHQSGNNSGVLHCGLYYKPGSLKAKLAVTGIREMVSFCQENDIAHEICGKLVVATDELEESRLSELESRGRSNGLTGIRRLSRSEMLEREPHVAGVAALEVPEEGIVDYPQVCLALRRKLAASGHSILCDFQVSKLDRRSSNWVVSSKDGKEVEVDFIVNCAGLHSDRICEAAGSDPADRIIPFRGEYYKLKPESQSLVNHLIYPVPDPSFPFLGVHFTRLIHGGIEAGPNAVLAFAREGYRKTDFNMGDFVHAITYPGLWKFICRYPTMCCKEFWRSLSKARFCNALQKLVPAIQVEDLEEGGAGVRAQAMSGNGDLVQDFSLVEGDRALHVLNAPSPAATASLAIGGELVNRLTRQMG